MAALEIPENLRCKDEFHHIDMGFLNRRLCITALTTDARHHFREHSKPGTDHMTVLSNDHFLVTVLLDCCEAMKVPTLLEALGHGAHTHLFRSTERLAKCPEIYDTPRVYHAVELDLDFGKPVRIAYHTKHLVSDTGKMVLFEGEREGHVNAIIGLLHDKNDRFEVEPLVIGAPWFDHPRNGADSSILMWHGRDFGEILPEDIDQFSMMNEVQVESTGEWIDTMRSLPEKRVKEAISSLLFEPPKKDWGGESDDHFSANVTV